MKSKVEMISPNFKMSLSLILRYYIFFAFTRPSYSSYSSNKFAFRLKKSCEILTDHDIDVMKGLYVHNKADSNF